MNTTFKVLYYHI